MIDDNRSSIGPSRSTLCAAFEDVAVIDACCLSVDSTHDASAAVCAHNTSWTSVTLKFRLGITKGHCKWHHLIDRTRVPVSDP